MSTVVLDTDVWSFLFKGDSRAEQYRPYLEDNALCISFQTVAELYQWIETAGWGEKRRAGDYEGIQNLDMVSAES